jgi:putative membrane-bound dehydrogenase-like protein
MSGFPMMKSRTVLPAVLTLAAAAAIAWSAVASPPTTRRGPSDPPPPAAAALPAATGPAVGDLAPELPRIPPRTPAESAAMIRTLAGFKAQLVAAEPLVFSPVAIDFDEDGRAFVCEMVDYPFPSPEPMGRIAVLEDTDNDGIYDKRTVLADKLHWPTAVLCYDGGCFVGSAPDILYLKDGDADGKADAADKADVRKVVFTGFGKQNVQGLLNSFRWGIDNRVQGATGTNGGKVRRADLPAGDAQGADPKDAAPKDAVVNLSGRDFSFDPRKLDLRPESGGAQHGMSFDDFGRKFVSSNSDHIQQVVYDDRYAAALATSPGGAGVQLPPARVSIAADGPQAPVFRISPVEPWRVVRTRMRVSGQSKGLVEGGGTPAGYFTGATGVTIYRGDAFPPEYKGQAFIGDVGSNLVHRKVLKPTGGVLLRAERVDEGKEFLASADIWFRPAQFANAPDGTLYVLDVCREVIEHPDSLPESIRAHLDLTSGRDRGRIYRVVADGYVQKPVPKFGKQSTAELVKLLEHPNGWHRDTASRLLYQRQDKAAVETLSKVDSTAVPSAYVHALYALASLGDAEALEAAIWFHRSQQRPPGGPSPEELVHVTRVSERLKNSWPLSSRKDGRTSPELELQRALTFGALKNLPASEAQDRDDELVEILRSDGADPYVRAAAVGSIGDPVGVATRLAANRAFAESAAGPAALRVLARRVGAGPEPAAVALANVVETLPHARAASAAILLGLRDGAPRPMPPELGRVLHGWGQNLADEATGTATDAGRPLAERVEALSVVSLGAWDESLAARLASLLGGKEPQEVQLAAVAALDAYAAEPAVGDVLTKAWPRLTPRVRAAALDAVLARPARAVAFLSAIEAGKIPAADLDAARLQRLRASKDAKVRSLADAVAKRSALSPRADVVAAYRKALDLKGDPAVGKGLFAQNCATCHKLEGVGVEIGPNLVSMQSRGAEAVLVNVLDPNREVNGQFVEYVVETKDGRSLSGLLASETAAAVTLLKPGGQAETVARADIEKLRGSGLSLMPEGLEKQFDPQQLADLIAYVMAAK